MGINEIYTNETPAGVIIPILGETRGMRKAFEVTKGWLEAGIASRLGTFDRHL